MFVMGVLDVSLVVPDLEEPLEEPLAAALAAFSL